MLISIMMDYKKLNVWQFSRALASKVYMKTKDFPKEERYGLTNQIRRCVISIPANIAEGCGRRSNKDTLRFLYISRGSIYELETHLFISLDLDLIGQDVFEDLNEAEKSSFYWSLMILSGILKNPSYTS